MQIKIYLFLLVFLSFNVHVSAGLRGKDKKKAKNADQEQTKMLSDYEKLFKGHDVQTAKGPLTLHYFNGKVYLEMPVGLLGRLWLFTSSIVNSGSPGEGFPGQWSGKNIFLEFRKNGSSLDACAVMLKQAGNLNQDQNLAKALEDVGLPGIYRKFKIETYTPDSSAVVVDATDFFMNDDKYTNPFPSKAGNAVYGLVVRNQTFHKDKSKIQNVKAFGKNVAVTMQLSYSTMNAVLGVGTPVPVPATMICNRMLYLLPEKTMSLRLADSRIGVEQLMLPEIPDVGSGYKHVPYVKRWRVEPLDTRAYSRGELVEPVQPIIFYLDTLMPAAWRAYVKAGVEAWNPAFEKIGFRNVIRVLDFPRDPLFDASNIENSTIWYCPSWMSRPWQIVNTDPRSGEVFSASIYLPNGMMDALRVLYAGDVMGADSTACAEHLPESVMGELIKQLLTNFMGRCLGLTENPGVAHAYPVDSLRSPSFTQKYGLSPSIMSYEMEYNSIAQPEDVDKGVRLIPNGPGAYDDYAIRWIYKPIPGASTPRAEKDTLDQWLKEQRTNPWLRYKRPLPAEFPLDPTAVGDGYGDDHLKACKYWIENMKRSVAHGFDWLRSGRDKTYDFRGRLSNILSGKTMNFTMNAVSYVGGMMVNDVYGDDPTPVFTPVPLEKQEEVIQFVIKLRDMKFPEYPTAKFELGDMQNWNKFMKTCAFGALLIRFPFVLTSMQETGQGYDPDKYMQHIFDMAWSPALKGQELTNQDLSDIYYYLASLMNSADAKMTTLLPPMPRGMGIALANCPLKEERKLVEQHFKDPGAFPLVVAEPWLDGPLQKSLYTLRPIKAKRTDAVAIHYRWLKKSCDLLERMIPRSQGNTKLAYEYFLHQINSVLKEK